jgi:hypothetical protein
MITISGFQWFTPIGLLDIEPADMQSHITIQFGIGNTEHGSIMCPHGYNSIVGKRGHRTSLFSASDIHVLFCVHSFLFFSRMLLPNFYSIGI